MFSHLISHFSPLYRFARFSTVQFQGPIILRLKAACLYYQVYSLLSTKLLFPSSSARQRRLLYLIMPFSLCQPDFFFLSALTSWFLSTVPQRLIHNTSLMSFASIYYSFLEWIIFTIFRISFDFSIFLVWIQPDMLIWFELWYNPCWYITKHLEASIRKNCPSFMLFIYV